MLALLEEKLFFSRVLFRNLHLFHSPFSFISFLQISFEIIVFQSEFYCLITRPISPHPLFFFKSLSYNFKRNIRTSENNCLSHQISLEHIIFQNFKLTTLSYVSALSEIQSYQGILLFFWFINNALLLCAEFIEINDFLISRSSFKPIVFIDFPIVALFVCPAKIVKARSN